MKHPVVAVFAEVEERLRTLTGGGSERGCRGCGGYRELFRGSATDCHHLLLNHFDNPAAAQII
jgi:hypothetical protein